MMLAGRIEKEAGPWWYAECDAIGAYTQGTSRRHAATMLADAIETKIGRDGLGVRVIEIGRAGDDAFDVLVASDHPHALITEVLRHQRNINKLTLAEVAEKLGASSINSYAAYERGKREPSISKLCELLAAVAPDIVLVVSPRSPSRVKR